jgi:Zn-dependent protease
VRIRPGEEIALMFGSLKLGKLFGIDLYLHGTFWLLPLFVLFNSLGGGTGYVAFQLLFVFAVFGCVALHEVGHALAAAAYGVRTRDITLYPIGGVASLERMPEKPWQEVAVALAGPAVNVAIAFGLLLGMGVSGMPMPWEGAYDAAELFVQNVLVANAFLALFNLLPAFPMDGGRVLRALLSTGMARLRATEAAVAVGTVVAAGLLVAGIAWTSINLIVIAGVVWFLGQAELASIRIAEKRREYERRAREFFEGPAAEPGPVDADAVLAARRFSGMAWDERRRIWVQWVNGVPVRDLPT